MKQLILLVTLGFLVIAVGFALHVRKAINNATLHITETRPKKVSLIQGTNSFSFPVVKGQYLLRIGGENLEPAKFPFSIRGYVDGLAGRTSLDEDYQPSVGMAQQGKPKEGVSRKLEIPEGQTQVVVMIVADFPEEKRLTLSFFGIK